MRMGMLKKNRSKTRTNLTLRGDLVEEARALGLNLSELAERALESALAERRLADWAKENKAGLDALNRIVETGGLPLASRRLF